MRGLIALVLTGIAAAAPAQEIALVNGETVVFEIPAATGSETVANTAFFVDVPEGRRNLLLELEGEDAGRDLDLLVRADEPFSDSTDLDALIQEADYWSISAFGEEYVNIQDFAHEPVDGRRWHIAVVAFAGAVTDATLRATLSSAAAPRAQIEVDFANTTGASECNVAPWNDSAAHTPIGGNDATTVGEARRKAMLRAADTLSRELTSRVPIRIRACWRDQGGRDDNGGLTLASARSNQFPVNTPGLRPDTIYSQAAGTRLAGTDVCRVFGGDGCEEQEVLIFFNESAADGFYYGFKPGTGESPGRDFITVAMHEITHGLGFFDFLDDNGTLPALNGRVITDIYTHQLATLDDSGLPIRLDDPSLSDADRLEAMTSFTRLLWFDEQANVQEANTLFTFEAGLLRMHAPPQLEPGSSISHVSGAYCDLMRPSLGLCRDEAIRSLGLSRRILDGVGWADSPNRPAYVGLLFDRNHAGHGFDFQLAGLDAEGREVYVLTFYSYETRGLAPEWFQAVGTFENGAFTGLRNDDGNGFPRYLYDVANSPPQQADPDTFSQVALSFNNIAKSVACADGVDRLSAQVRASFQWGIGNQVGEWCVEPLVASSALPDPEDDFGGLWFAGVEDQGWGFSLENIVQPDGTVDLFALLYVYAADGTPVWFFGIGEEFVPGQPITLTMFQRTGFPRIRETGELSDQEAGTMTLLLNGLDAENRASVNVNYLGPEGGSWVRDDTEITRLSQPRPY